MKRSKREIRFDRKSLYISLIRIACAAIAGIESIIRMDPDIIFTAADAAAVKDIFDGAAGSVRVPDGRTAHWRPPPAYMETQTLLRVLLKRLSRPGKNV